MDAGPWAATLLAYPQERPRGLVCTVYSKFKSKSNALVFKIESFIKKTLINYSC